MASAPADPSPRAAVVQDPAATSAPGEDPHATSAVEAAVMKEVGAVAENARLAEPGYREAWVEADFAGSRVVVHAMEPGEWAPAEDLGRTTTAGVSVMWVANDTWGVLARFSCEPYAYEVTVLDAGQRPGSATADAVRPFVDAFVPSACD